MRRDPREVLTRRAPAADRVVAYGPGADRVVDLRLPPTSAAAGASGNTGPRPLVVVIHGGFWRAAYDRTHAGSQAAALAAEGYVVAVPEYRRVGSPGGGWPGTFDDTAQWNDRLLGLVEAQLGPGAVDAQRVVLVGHSAGGHLALWSASRHLLPDGSPWHRRTPLPVRGVVSLAGVTNLELAARLGLGSGAAAALMGGEPGGRHDERYAQGDPARLLPAAVRTVLVHGLQDENVPASLSRDYAERSRTAGGHVEVSELPHCGHFELIDPLSDAWPTVTRAVRDVLG